MEMKSKLCTVCGEEKPLSEYYKDSRGKDGLYAKCKGCHCKATKAVVLRDRDKERARQRDWYGRNKIHARETKYKWRTENPEAYQTIIERHKDKPETRIKRAAYHKKRQQEFPEKSRKKNKLRTKRKNENGGKFGAKEMATLLEIYGNKCLCCCEIGNIEADHVIPLSKGGSNDISNRQPLCPKCNLRKSNKIIDYRMEQ